MLPAILNREHTEDPSAANGTLGVTQRATLDDEAQALSQEYFRIARSTKFNGINVLDGSIQGLRLQSGYGSTCSIFASLGGKMGTGELKEVPDEYVTEGGGSKGLSLADLNGDGVIDMVTAGGNTATVRLGIGDGTFSSTSTTYTTESTGSNALTLGDLNGDGILDLVTGGNAGGVATITTRLGVGDGSFSASSAQYTYEGGSEVNAIVLSDLNNDGNLDIVTAGMFGMSVRMGTGSGGFSSSNDTYSTETFGSSTIALSDLNGDGITDVVTGGEPGGTVRLGTGGGAFSSTETKYGEDDWMIVTDLSLADLNGDNIADLVYGAGWDGAVVLLGLGNGQFSATEHQYLTESAVLALSDLNDDSILDLATGGLDGTNYVRMGIGNGEFSNTYSDYTALQENAIAFADLNRDGIEDFVSVSTDGVATVRLGITKYGTAPLLEFDLKTAVNARQAISLFNQKLEQLSVQRGEIGAFQACVGLAVNTTRISAENFAVASSRITDADIAEESANLVRLQILQQAGFAILSQANQKSEIALKLLHTE